MTDGQHFRPYRGNVRVCDVLGSSSGKADLSSRGLCVSGRRCLLAVTGLVVVRLFVCLPWGGGQTRREDPLQNPDL